MDTNEKLQALKQWLEGWLLAPPAPAELNEALQIAISQVDDPQENRDLIRLFS